ncbi:MAG: hypothetical protein K2F63_01350, partial [Muribaculaceae bacterium]|nr:hypothetical protein [Muribaculaceae bacterium]
DNTMQITGGQMSKITITLAKDAANRNCTVTPSTGSITPAQAAGDTSFTWVGDASSVTFTVAHDTDLGSDGPNTRGQIRFTSVEIFPAE